METAIKERPIIFSGDMVRAILDGRKTQTRRVMKKQPGDGRDVKRCPYGNPGDRLWVRETFVLEDTGEYHGEHDVPMDGRPIQKHEDDWHGEYWLIPHYRATEPEPHIVPYSATLDGPNDDRTRWTPAIYMPRKFSRITLEVVGVRVEQIKDISEDDAKAEGVKPIYSYREGFVDLWDSINAKRGYGWETNPCVRVIEFKRLEVKA